MCPLWFLYHLTEIEGEGVSVNHYQCDRILKEACAFFGDCI